MMARKINKSPKEKQLLELFKGFMDLPPDKNRVFFLLEIRDKIAETITDTLKREGIQHR